MAFKLTDAEIVDMPELKVYGIEEEVAPQDLGEFYGRAYGKLGKFVQENAIDMAGMPVGLYHYWPQDNEGKAVVEAGFPVKVHSVEASGEVKATTIEAGKAIKVVLTGDYNHLADAHGACHQCGAENHLNMKDPAIEVYVTDPGQEPDPGKWVTEVYYPIEL